MEEKNINKNQAGKETKKDGSIVKDTPKDEKVKKAGLKIKSWILLLIIDFLMLIISTFFIVSLPKKAADLNKARSDEQKVKESKNIDVTGLEYKPTKDSVDKLNSYYPEEAGVIDFIEAIEVLKENGYVKNFSLVGADAVKDKTGAFGIPFVVEFEGDWGKINLSLQELQKLPYLMRAINVEARVVDENVINFKYGGFLYVSDSLAKTR